MSPRQLRFDGQVAIVSGAGRDLGRAIAFNLAARGAAVVGNDLGCTLRGEQGGNAGPAESVVAEIRAAGGVAIPVVADIGSARDEVIQAALEWGGVHIVVHNASPVMLMTSLEQATQEGFDTTLRVSALGSWELGAGASVLADLSCPGTWTHDPDQIRCGPVGPGGDAGVFDHQIGAVGVR